MRNLLNDKRDIGNENQMTKNKKKIYWEVKFEIL